MGYAEDNKKLAAHLPDSNLSICEENLDLFFRTMMERQEIWYKRTILQQERPWTKDEIFLDYKFTNVYRELDRNSQYQIENIIKLGSVKNLKELVWRIMFFRFFNNPEFFEFILKLTTEAEELGCVEYKFVGIIPPYKDFDSKVLEEFMIAARANGINPFTNAYLTNSQACPGQTRDYCFAYKVIPTLHSMIDEILEVLRDSKKPEEIIKVLLKLPSVSHFMAHEFYQDFTYAPRYLGVRLMPFDQDDYTNVGPGADAGIRWIFPDRKTSKEKLQAIYDLRDIANDYLENIGDFKYLGYIRSKNRYFKHKRGKITLHQIEMWLCEFQKYKKMQLKIGKQRYKFEPKN